MKPTLTARLAWVQTGVTITALALVMLGTYVGVTAMLTWQTDQHLQSSATRMAGYLQQASRQDPDWDWLRHETAEVCPPDGRIEVRDATGEVRLAAGAGTLPAVESEVGCDTRLGHRVCSLRSGAWLIRVGRQRAVDLAIRDQLTLALALVSLLAGVGVALTSRVVTRRALRPFSEVARRVAAIEPGSGERVELQAGFVEVDTLADRFNDLVARFEDALEREKRFVAHASHELRTPLTIARAEVEELLHSSSDGGGAARALSALVRLAALVDTLLWFARAQGRLDDERMGIVNIADLVRDLTGEFERSQPGRTFVVSAPEEALVRGDETLLGRAVSNLLENAFKYGDDSAIRLVLRRSERELELELAVGNGGTPIPSNLHEQIFLPFVRAHVEPDQPTGFGLGLPFARAVARAHGGDVLLRSSSAEGTEVSLRLPLVAWIESASAPA